MPIMAISLHRFPTGFSNSMLESRDRLLLWRSGSSHVENLLLQNRAVKVVDTVAQRKLRKRKPHAHPVGGEVIDVIQIDAANREVLQLFDRGCLFDVSQHRCLRLKREGHEPSEPAGFVLELAQLT